MYFETTPDTATSTPVTHLLGGDEASVIFTEGSLKTEIKLRGTYAKAAPLIAAIFRNAGRNSDLFDLTEAVVTVDDDGPDGDSIADLMRTAQFHADAVCPCCHAYRPDEDEWHEIDGRLMCSSCCDDEAAKYAETNAHTPSAADLRRPGLAVYAMVEGL